MDIGDNKNMFNKEFSKVCLTCEKSFKTYNPKVKYCDKCRDEVKTFYKGRFKNKLINYDYIICRECGKKFASIHTSHLRSSYCTGNLKNRKEYSERYPNETLTSVNSLTKKQKSSKNRASYKHTPKKYKSHPRATVKHSKVKSPSLTWKPSIKKVNQKSEIKICPYCRKRITQSTHHILPRDFGGADVEENKIDLCVSCHDEVEILTYNLLKKGHYTIDDLRSFIINQGFPNEDILKDSKFGISDGSKITLYEIETLNENFGDIK